MTSECFVCGESHDPETHGEAQTVLQPSLHNQEEWTDLLLGEAGSYGCNVDDTRKMLDTETDEERFDWAQEEALSSLQSVEGIFVVFEEDSFLIFDNRKSRS